MATTRSVLLRSLLAVGVAATAACSSSPAPRTAPPGGAPTTTLGVAFDAELGKRVDAVIDQAIADQQIVGVVALIARDGVIVYSRVGGLADREAAQPVREDTVFRYASMSKPIVSVAALALVDQGKLALEDPVTKWLPEFKPKLADGSTPTITVRHLITHTSGLTYAFLEPPDGPYHKAKVADGLAEPGLGADENLRRLASVPLLYEPGTAWNYSLSVDVLGEVVARAGGGTLPEVVARVITDPLGMSSTTFTVTDRERVAWPYAVTEGGPPARMTEPYDMSMMGMTVRFSPARLFDGASFPSGGAGLAGTAADYLRFCEALRTGTPAILTPETRRALVADELVGKSKGFLGPGQSFGLGVGLLVDPAAAKEPVGPGTFYWAGIYGTTFWVDPEAKLSVVVMANVAGQMSLDGALKQAIYAR